jgi:AraC-like DNA-binding protein
MHGSVQISSDTVIPLQDNEILKNYFTSLLIYFQQDTAPSRALLKLKFEELLVSILSDTRYLAVKSYFAMVSASDKPSIREIMEANFTRTLTLSEFARLCARSLSGFKLEFRSLFNTSPGKWLLQRRLEYSRHLLECSDRTIEDISYKSGFKNRSHFIRVFKAQYAQTPGAYRTHHNTNTPKNTH